MNAIAPGMNVLATCEALTALDVFVEGAPEKLVSRLEEYVRALPVDMETTKGRDAIRSLAAKISRTKTGLDELGKEHVAALKKQTGAVDVQRKLIRDRLDDLRDEVRKPLTEFEEAEANRINGHEAALVIVIEGHLFDGPATPTQIMERQVELSRLVERDWQEFGDRANAAYQVTFPRLEGMRVAAEKAEADAAELIKLRRFAAEQEARDVAARLEVEKAARAEAERLTAERAVEAERIREEQRQKDRVAAAEAAAAKAVEDERKRVAKVEADEAAAKAKLERNKKHRAKIHGEIVGFLMVDAGLSNDHAHRVVEEIVAGKIPHVRIEY